MNINLPLRSTNTSKQNGITFLLSNPLHLIRDRGAMLVNTAPSSDLMVEIEFQASLRCDLDSVEHALFVCGFEDRSVHG